MILRYFIENYKSFEEKTEFNMLPGSYKRHTDHIYRDKINNIDILRVSAIYGANGAGKTNFIDSLRCLKRIVTKGTLDLNDTLLYYPFKLNKECLTKPTHLELDFLFNNNMYSYGITYNSKIVSEEWLYFLKQDGSNELIFDRITNAENLKSSIKYNVDIFSNNEDSLRFKIYEEDLRHNQPFVYEGFNKKLKYISEAYLWFSSNLDFIFVDSNYNGLPYNLIYKEKFREMYCSLMKLIVKDIVSIDVKEIPFDEYFGKESKLKSEIEGRLSKEKGIVIQERSKRLSAYINKEDKPVVGKLVLMHSDKDSNLIEFDFVEESKGIQRLIDLIPALIYSLTEDNTIVIDEVESSIHPLVIEMFIKIYLKNLTPKCKGQLIFTSHESHLLNLDIFRQDEIWLAEKVNNQKTSLYSLSDFKPRFDLNIEKGYIEGKFGAIPFIGDSTKLKIE